MLANGGSHVLTGAEFGKGGIFGGVGGYFRFGLGGGVF